VIQYLKCPLSSSFALVWLSFCQLAGVHSVHTCTCLGHCWGPPAYTQCAARRLIRNELQINLVAILHLPTPITANHIAIIVRKATKTKGREVFKRMLCITKHFLSLTPCIVSLKNYCIANIRLKTTSTYHIHLVTYSSLGSQSSPPILKVIHN